MSDLIPREDQAPYKQVCLNILTRGGDIQETRTIHPAPGELIRIGRASSAASKNMVAGPNNAMFDSRVMSRCHAHIEAPTGLPGPLMLTDTSKYGTFVNDRRVTKDITTMINDGDKLRFGATVTDPTTGLPVEPVQAEIRFNERDDSPLQLRYSPEAQGIYPSHGTYEYPYDSSEEEDDEFDDFEPHIEEEDLNRFEHCSLSSDFDEDGMSVSNESDDSEEDESSDSEDADAEAEVDNDDFPRSASPSLSHHSALFDDDTSGTADTQVDCQEMVLESFQHPEVKPDAANDQCHDDAGDALMNDHKSSNIAHPVPEIDTLAAVGGEPANQVPSWSGRPETQQQKSNEQLYYRPSELISRLNTTRFDKPKVSTPEIRAEVQKKLERVTAMLAAQKGRDHHGRCLEDEREPPASSTLPSWQTAAARLRDRGYAQSEAIDSRDFHDKGYVTMRDIAEDFDYDNNDTWEALPIPADFHEFRPFDLERWTHPGHKHYSRVPLDMLLNDGVSEGVNPPRASVNMAGRPRVDSRLAIDNLIEPKTSAVKATTGTKRKADEMEASDTPVHPPAIAAKPQVAATGQTSHAVQTDEAMAPTTPKAVATPHTESRPLKRLRTATRAAVTAAAYAAIGSIATIGFLASPLAERLAGL